MHWTNDQRAAIEARGENLLLAAAAGSGKTTVLVERVATLLQEGADVREMLIVTFTRAAASDMRMSLIRRLTALAQEDPRFRQQAEYAEFASISTIHSFCSDLLRAFFQAAGVDPAFRIADSAEAGMLRAKALETAMNEAYAACTPDHEALVSGRTPDEIRDLALRTHAFLMERPDPWGWLDEKIAALERSEDRFSDILADDARRALNDALAVAGYAEELCISRGVLAPYAKTAQADRELIESLVALTGYEELRSALQKLPFARKPSVKGAKDNDDCILYDNLRDRVKSLAKKAGERLPVDLASAVSDLPGCAAELRGLREIVRALDEEYTRLKDEKSLLTFTDLERRSLHVLKDETVVQAVRERYAYVFVDEYQDVSDVQEAILSTVARENGHFCVGDVKQSIYRFRHAEPTLFMKKHDAYRAHEGGRLIVLNQNFRSRRTVLDYTNCVFERAMRGGDTEIVYDAAARLYPGAQFEGEDPPVELHVIDGANFGEETDSESAQLIAEMKDAEAEALLVARRIRQLRGSMIWDGKKGIHRPLEWRDFVILTRQAKDVAQQMLSVLRREGVPSYADVSGGYLDVMEVQAALALLRLVENRRRDPEWIAVLRSPFMNLTSGRLARIRARFPEGGYADAVAAYAELSDPGDAELADILAGFLRQLDRWRALHEAMPLAQLVFTVLSESGFYSVVGALPGGGQRQANLDMLCDRAAAFEQGSAGGLTGFLAHIESMNSIREDMGEAHILGENDDVVRIMTVHKSKGLEFPVVFGVMMGRRPGGGRRGALSAHREVGIGLTHMDASLGTCRESLPHLAAESLGRREADAEELRILYVLLTRARDRLILTGSVKSLRDSVEKWRMSYRQPVTPDSYLDLVVPPMCALPGGEDLAGADRTADDKLPHVDIHLITRTELISAEDEKSQDSTALMDAARAMEPDAALTEAYRWKYPHEEAVLLPLKLTASGISREITGPAQPPELIPRPAFLSQEESGMTGAERGTATHAALQGLDLTALQGLTGDALHSAVVVQLNALAEQGVLTEAMRGAVRPMTLTRFLEGDIGRRMLNAETLRREWMFTLRMSTEEAVGVPSNETLLVQGAVDCCFIEDGEWILLDYKTDRAQDEEALVERYAPQLKLYARALAEITGRPVREVWLCLLGGGRAIRMDVCK